MPIVNAVNWLSHGKQEAECYLILNEETYQACSMKGKEAKEYLEACEEKENWKGKKPDRLRK